MPNKRTVAHGVGANLFGDLDLPLGDEWPGDGCAEEVGALVHGVGAEHGEHVVADKLLAKVVDVNLCVRMGKRLGIGFEK